MSIIFTQMRKTLAIVLLLTLLVSIQTTQVPPSPNRFTKANKDTDSKKHMVKNTDTEGPEAQKRLL
jgi:predicted RND superfamily exporter protein